MFTIDERSTLFTMIVNSQVPKGVTSINVLETLILRDAMLDQSHPEITLCPLIKEKIVNKKPITVKVCRLPRIIKAAANGDSPQIHWNSHRRSDTLSLEELNIQKQTPN